VTLPLEAVRFASRSLSALIMRSRIKHQPILNVDKNGQCDAECLWFIKLSRSAFRGRGGQWATVFQIWVDWTERSIVGTLRLCFRFYIRCSISNRGRLEGIRLKYLNLFFVLDAEPNLWYTFDGGRFVDRGRFRDLVKIINKGHW